MPSSSPVVAEALFEIAAAALAVPGGLAELPPSEWRAARARAITQVVIALFDVRLAPLPWEPQAAGDGTLTCLQLDRSAAGALNVRPSNRVRKA
jgi:hypothetical protein